MVPDRLPGSTAPDRLAPVVLARPRPAVEPATSPWLFPTLPAGDAEPGASQAGGSKEHGRPDEVIGVGADLEPGTLLAAYRAGVFPMPIRRGLMGWWSPDPRGVIPLDGLRVTRSLRRSCARYQIRIDTDFEQVIDSCGDKRRPGAWINKDIKSAYTRLHELGWVHSVEAWDDEGRLAGGLYGVAIGGFFAGESMFHRRTDASKVALVALVQELQAAEAALLDVQWATGHLASLGAVEISRRRYQALLAAALERPQPAVFGGPAGPASPV